MMKFLFYEFCFKIEIDLTLHLRIKQAIHI